MPTTRRQFIYSASAIGASLALSNRSLLANSPSERINLGIIGCGGRGVRIARFFNEIPGVRIQALCDADRDLVEKASSDYPHASKHTDMRHVFDSPDIDAVAIATSNHWHCLAAIWAMQAGKHVYVEKPLGQTQWEGEQVVKATAKYNLICQVGTQQRSDPMQAEIKDFLHNQKALGEIESVRVNRFGQRNTIGLRKKPLVVSKSVDYDMWLGPAQDLPIYRNQLNYDWHWDWNTGSGEMGNWGVHIVDDVRNNIFLDRLAAPTSIVAGGGRYMWNDAGNTPNVHFALLETDGIPVVVTLSNLPFDKKKDKPHNPPSGYVAYCSQGRLEAERGSAKAFDLDGNLIKEFQGDIGVRHQSNFIDAIRQNKSEILNAPIKIGYDSTSWCNLINIATKVKQPETDAKLPSINFGEETTETLLQELNTNISKNTKGVSNNQLSIGPKMYVDSKTAIFTGQYQEQANAFLRREDRRPFEVPEITVG